MQMATHPNNTYQFDNTDENTARFRELIQYSRIDGDNGGGILLRDDGNY
jgi:hypothetical protein